MEKRDFTRITFKTEAIVSLKDQEIRGEVKNLSLKGMFLLTPKKIDMNEEATIKILLSGASSELFISVTGLVVRVEENGVAFQLTGMDLDSFIHLKNVIAYNEGDEGKVMEEFFKFMSRA